MHLTINGEKRVFQENLTVEELLKELSLEGKVMAAAVNMNIVKQDQWKIYTLQDGDTVELLDFVGGG